MILPFVRELFADLEHSPSFEQARRHLTLARGRRRVSGLTSSARALYLPLFARAANVPVVVVVADNKAADTLQVSLRAGCELTGAIAPNRVLKLPAHDEQRRCGRWPLTPARENRPCRGPRFPAGRRL